MIGKELKKAVVLQGIASRLVLTLFVGFCVPLSIGFLYSLFVERHQLEEELAFFHKQSLDALARSVEDPLYAFSPDAALNAASVLIHDERILQIDVYSEIYNMYLAKLPKANYREKTEKRTERRIVTKDGNRLGYVEITIDLGYMAPFISAKRKQTLFLFSGMLIIGLGLVIPFIYSRIILPIQRLTRQAEKYSNGDLTTSHEWEGRDELGSLGKMMELMRINILQSFKIIEELSLTDELTSISNRRAFLSELNKFVEQGARYDRPFTLLMLDLDHFKKVNDTFGHNVGDEVLIEVTRVVMSRKREVDVFSRIGGEEFALCLPETNLENGEHVAEEIRRAVSEHHFTKGLNITISAGLAEFKADDTPETIMRNADSALYEAKRRGRNCVVAYKHL